MFCRYCAAPLDDNAKVCPKCGRDQFDQINSADPAQNEAQARPAARTAPETPAAGIPQPPQGERPTSAKLGSELYRMGYNKKIRTRLIAVISVMSALGVVFLVTALLNLFLLSNPDYVIVGMLFVFAVVMVFVVFSSARQLQAAGKTFICVTQNGIYGSGGNAKYNEAQTFDLTYDRINKVSSLPNHLMIETGGATIYCLLENPKDVEAVIDRTMAAYKTANP